MIISNFNIIRFLLLSIIYLPPISEGLKTYRLDSFLLPIIYILFLIQKIRLGTLTFSINRNLIPFFGFLFFSILPLFFQIIFLSNPIIPLSVLALGNLRFFFMSHILLDTKFSNIQLIKIINLILFGIVFHGICVLLNIFSIQPLANLINLIYRFGIDNDYGSLRAIGAFDTIHSLSFFGITSLIFTIWLNFYNQKNKVFSQKLLIAASFCSLICILTTYSIATYCAFIFIIICLFLKQLKVLFFKNVLNKKIIFSSLLVISFLNLFLYFFRKQLSNFVSVFDTIGLAFSFLTGSSYENELPIFIQGRLDWGWANSLQAFYKSPFFGDISNALTDFAGDGGYTELLGNFGILGFIGFLFFISLFLSPDLYFANLYKKRYFLGTYYLSFFIAIVFIMLATTFLRARVMELLPIYIIFPYYLSLINYKKKDAEGKLFLFSKLN